MDRLQPQSKRSNISLVAISAVASLQSLSCRSGRLVNRRSAVAVFIVAVAVFIVAVAVFIVAVAVVIVSVVVMVVAIGCVAVVAIVLTVVAVVAVVVAVVAVVVAVVAVVVAQAIALVIALVVAQVALVVALVAVVVALVVAVVAVVVAQVALVIALVIALVVAQVAQVVALVVAVVVVVAVMAVWPWWLAWLLWRGGCRNCGRTVVGRGCRCWRRRVAVVVKTGWDWSQPALWRFTQMPNLDEPQPDRTFEHYVQAPLSYSFRLLRTVILFIFSGDPSAPPRVPGHLFSVQHGISIGSPGEITCGRVWVKLSCAQDPYYSSRSLADLITAADAQGQDEEDLEDEDASWRWEGKDDLTLGHVWDIRSRDPKCGIIYHHGGKTSVHITLNTQTVPHHKGVGNMPFVFHTYGTVHLDPPHSPPSTPAPGAGSTSTHPYLPGAFSRHTGAASRARSSSWTQPTLSQSCRPPFALFHPRIRFFTSTLTAAPSQRPFVQKMSTRITLSPSCVPFLELAHLRKAVQVDKDGHGDNNIDEDSHGDNNIDEDGHGDNNNNEDKPRGGDNDNDNRCGGGIDNDHGGGGGLGGGDKGSGNGDNVMY
ncbi:hypothetical protein EDB85DRAFT_1899196 [Lactarius pseudohatsudake]|nr:hypothetical protein EDB85DRAFT_1899196 [Lactarius pseudohatsudake]